MRSTGYLTCEKPSEHDWGWVVGIAGFHEVVIIDRAASMLTLLVLPTTKHT